MKLKQPFDVVYPIACAVVEKLRPYCAQIEIAGSLRRQRSEIGDIEIVAQPLEYVPDLLGEPTEIHSLDLYAWTDLGVMGKGGHKYKQIWLDGSNIQLDLFIVTPPAQWGVIFLQRTGNDEFSHKFVTSKQYGGMKPACYSIRDGAVWCGARLVETPTERDLFKLFDVKYIPPVERQY
jgi:DNA polymerase/3'-5' exonuclease PolX